MVGATDKLAENSRIHILFRNLRVERPQRRALLSTMKAFLWATKFALKFPAVEGVLQSSAAIQALVSSVVRWVTGLGRHRLF